MLKGKIVEIFPSLQGEGIQLGEPQIFVRFGGCNLNCSYCDTPASKDEKYFKTLTIHDVLCAIDTYNAGKDYKTVAITGGEPLLQVDFLEVLLRELKKKKYSIYLDTNGTLPRPFKRVVSWCECVAMDIKLFSDTGMALWDNQAQFLRIGADKIFVKIVITMSTTDKEIRAATKLVAGVNPWIPVVLQPVTPINNIVPPLPSTIDIWKNIVGEFLLDVRVIPQQQVVWQVR